MNSGSVLKYGVLGVMRRIYILIVIFLWVCPLLTRKGRGTFYRIPISFFFTIKG